MEIKFLQTRINKLTMILIKIALMGLIMAGIILINKKYMSNAEGSEKKGQKTSIERVINSDSICKPGGNKINKITEKHLLRSR